MATNDNIFSEGVCEHILECSLNKIMLYNAKQIFILNIRRLGNY